MAASLLMGAAATAVAATPPPTLAGEAFSASMSVDDPTGAQFPFILGQCGNWSSYSTPSTFAIQGKATGPFPGSFAESGSVSYSSTGPGNNPFGQGPVLTFQSTFTITAPDGSTVSATGIANLVKNGDQASCWESAGGGGVDIGPFLAHYTAVITDPTGATHQDSGSSYVTLSQSVGLGEYWSADLSQSFFATPPPPPPTLTLSNLTVTVNGSTVNVSVDTSPAIVNVTLEEGGAKVAPDATPVNGVARWTVTGLAPGTHILAVQGWDSPSGQPGHHSGVQTYVVTVPPVPLTPPPSPTPQPAPTPAPTPTGPTPPPSSLGASTPPTSSGPAAPIRLLLPSKLGIAGVLRAGGYTWRLRTPTDGRVVVAWYRAGQLIASGHASIDRAGLVSVRIRLTAAGRRLLRTHRSLRLTAKATYTPTGGSAVSVTRVLRLR